MKKIIFDTDPGGDDVMAIVWLAAAVKAGACEVLAMTSAEGNTSSEVTYGTCQRLSAMLGFNANMAIGRGVETGKESDGFNGADGLGGMSSLLPPAAKDSKPWSKAKWSDDLIIEILTREPVHSVTIVAVAPLTNLAAAEAKSPGILRRAREVILMGGAFDEEGNVTPVAEFNIWFNPSALQVLLDSNANVSITPVDVTHRILFDESHLKAVKDWSRPFPPTPRTKSKSSSSKSSGSLSPSSKKEKGGTLNHLSERAKDVLHLVESIALVQIRQSLRFRQSEGKAGMVLHDSAALAVLFYPEAFKFSRANVLVDCKGKQNFGKTSVDKRHSLSKKAPNAWIAMGVEGPLVTAMFVEDLTAYLSELK